MARSASRWVLRRTLSRGGDADADLSRAVRSGRRGITGRAAGVQVAGGRPGVAGHGCGHRFRQSGCSAVGGELESGHRRRVAGVAFVAKYVNRQRGYDALWFDGRAVAETVKSATWRYAMGARPLCRDGEPTRHSSRCCARRCRRAPRLMPHLHHLPTESRQMPKGWTMSAPRRWRRGGRCTWRSGCRPGDMVRQQGRGQRPLRQPLVLGGHGGATGRAGGGHRPHPNAPGRPDVVAVFTTFAAAIAAWTSSAATTS